jgi:hypothetical protein
MVQVASEDYGLFKDDILSDTLSSVSNVFCNLGEILGPIVTGLVVGFFGFEDTCTSMAFACLSYLIFYSLGSGLVSKNCRRKEEKNNFSMKTCLVHFEPFEDVDK